jgi:uncharacterized protein (TIGR02996 family)
VAGLRIGEAARVTPLEQALRACERGDVAAAAAHVLAAWQARRAPHTAHLLEDLSRFLPLGDVDALAGRDAATQARWLAVANANDPADVPRLLVTLPEASPRELTERVRALADRRDPRVAMAIALLLFDAAIDPQLWKVLLAHIERTNDGRTTPVLRAASQHLERRATSAPLRQLSDLRRQVGQMIRKLTPGASVSDEDVAAAETILGTLAGLPPPARSPVEAGLLAAVLAAPDDDAPRLVYADWLDERGDPRGELVRLQLLGSGATAAQLARIDELLRQHRRRWLWPLVWRADEVRFERGFPVSVRVGSTIWELVHVMAHAPRPWLRALHVESHDYIQLGWLVRSSRTWPGVHLYLEPNPDRRYSVPALAELARSSRFERFSVVDASLVGGAVSYERDDAGAWERVP